MFSSQKILLVNTESYERATRYIIGQLIKKLPTTYQYHTVHHALDVVEMAGRYARKEGIGDSDLLILKTAAHYHDSGYLISDEDHEISSIRIAREALMKFGYTSEEAERVCVLILGTQKDREPVTKLQMIIKDADTDYLGRDDFFLNTERLRLERTAHGSIIAPRRWLESTRDLLKMHTYLTDAARTLREAKKAENARHLAELLAIPRNPFFRR